MTKVKVKALDAFAHGAISAQPGGIYEMNKGDAHELEKAGFVTLDVGEEVEQEDDKKDAAPDFRTETRYHLQEHELPPAAIAPDVPSEEELRAIEEQARLNAERDDADDLLGGDDAAEKMEGEADNKMADAPKNKASKSTKAK